MTHVDLLMWRQKKNKEKQRVEHERLQELREKECTFQPNIKKINGQMSDNNSQSNTSKNSTRNRSGNMNLLLALVFFFKRRSSLFIRVVAKQYL